MAKSLLTLIFCSLFYCSVSAQQYSPMLETTNHWTIVGNGLVVAPHHSSNPCSYPYFGTGFQSYDYMTGSDTLINGLTYKTVLLNDHNFTYSCDFGYVREDTSSKKIYFVDNLSNPEVLLYDFSMSVGDSMNTSFIVQGGYFADGYYTVDSISSISIAGGNRRVFHLSNHTTSWSHDMTWIESIGCMENPFYPYSSNFMSGSFANCPGSFHSYIEYVSCYEHVNKVYLDSCAFAAAMSNSCFLVEDSCSYFDVCGSVNELKNVKTFSLSPNPTHDVTRINFDISQSGEYQFSVVSITGQEIKLDITGGRFSAGMNHLQFSTATLTPGIYFVRCKNESGQAFKKLIVM
ncbi:MAG: T9SS type A sorting domain-containing protein [Bacteroidetes bacterium]|nr:T9SS type A sorting domain-containing protein [Bacteroidota bacterium]